MYENDVESEYTKIDTECDDLCLKHTPDCDGHCDHSETHRNACQNVPVTDDELASAVMGLYSTLCLLYKMDGYVSDDPRLSHLPPFEVPFASNVDEAVERFDQPRIREELVRRIYMRGNSTPSSEEG